MAVIEAWRLYQDGRSRMGEPSAEVGDPHS